MSEYFSNMPIVNMTSQTRMRSLRNFNLPIKLRIALSLLPGAASQDSLTILSNPSTSNVILGEEVASKLTVFYITKQICDAVQERTEKGKQISKPKRGFGFSLWKKATGNDNEEDEVYDLITIDPKPFPPPMKLCKDMVEAMGGAERLLNRDDTKEENISMDEAEEDGFLKLFKVSTTNGKHLCEKGNLKPLLNRTCLFALDNLVFVSARVLRDVNNISIGSGTNIQDHSLVHVAKSNLPGKVHPTVIGDNMTVGYSAILHGCTVEDEVFVGMKATLLDGVVVEKHAMVAAGALVRQDTRIPSGEVDLQAQARAYRIGQKKEVLVLRLETAKTVEEQVRASAEHKLGVANQSITAGFFDNNTSAQDRREYLEALLRECKKEEAAPVLNDDALNELLARRETTWLSTLVSNCLVLPSPLMDGCNPMDLDVLSNQSSMIALAIKDEVEGLEKAGIRVIQIDESALREGLLHKKAEHAFYLDWVVHSFRITNVGVADTTQAYRFSCYTNFICLLTVLVTTMPIGRGSNNTSGNGMGRADDCIPRGRGSNITSGNGRGRADDCNVLIFHKVSKKIIFS
ncbi:gamma carbonic anhydrase 1, mitochondrial [Tanacetum coccineum]